MYEGKMFGKIVDAAYSLFSGKWQMMPMPPDGSLAFLVAIVEDIPSISKSSIEFENLMGKFAVKGVYRGRVECENRDKPYTIKHSCLSYVSSSIPQLLNRCAGREDLKEISFEAEIRNYHLQESVFLKDFDEWWWRHEGRVKLDAKYGKKTTLTIELIFHSFGNKGGVYFDSLTFEEFSGNELKKREAVSFPKLEEKNDEEERIPYTLSVELTKFTHQIFGDAQKPLEIERNGERVNVAKLTEKCLAKVPAPAIEKDLDSFGNDIKRYAVRNMLSDIEKLYFIGVDGGLIRSYKNFIVKNGLMQPSSYS